MRNQCAVLEELACFQYSLNDNSSYREKLDLKYSGVIPFRVLGLMS